MKTISRVEWGVIVFAALVIIGQTIRVYPQLLLFFGGLIAGVITEKVCRWRKSRKQREQIESEHRCEIVPFPTDLAGGGGA